MISKGSDGYEMMKLQVAIAVLRFYSIFQFLEKPYTVFKSEKHVKIVETVERHLPKMSKPTESKGSRLAKKKVIGDFQVRV